MHGVVNVSGMGVVRIFIAVAARSMLQTTATRISRSKKHVANDGSMDQWKQEVMLLIWPLKSCERVWPLVPRGKSCTFLLYAEKSSEGLDDDSPSKPNGSSAFDTAACSKSAEYPEFFLTKCVETVESNVRT